MLRTSRRRASNSRLETLEQRALLTTITVTSLADNLDDDGQTTLREAIAEAGATKADDDIVFADGLNGVIALTILNDDETNEVRIGSKRLKVTGTPNDDVIEFELDSLYVHVRMNDQVGSFLRSAYGRVQIHAGDGDDVIDGTQLIQETKVFGEEGDDTIMTGAGFDYLDGGPGHDHLDGGDNGDILLGSTGNDSLLGGDGGDSLRGGNGKDTLRGGAAADVVKGDNGADFIHGNEGFDKLHGGGGNDDLRAGKDDDTVTGNGGQDTIDGGFGADSLTGGADADEIFGSDGDDTIDGGDGADYLHGGKGFDLILGGTGKDTLLGRQGSDVLLGENGSDLLVGFSGRDILYGGGGADTLRGQGGDDLLLGAFVAPESGGLQSFLSGGILDEWLSSRDYETRVHNVWKRTGGTDDRLNTEYLIGANRTGQTVFADGARDVLTGGGALDLFFARSGSDVFDQAASEFLEEL